MNIIIIGPFPQDATQICGGVQASVYGLSKALTTLGHRVTGIALPTTRRDKRHGCSLDGVAVNYFNAPLGFLASSVLHLPRILRIIRAQTKPVVHVHSTGLPQLFIMLSLRLLRTPYVWTLHGITEIETRQQFERHPSFSNYLRHRFYTRIEHAMLRIARLIIVDTEYVKAALPHNEKIRVIPQGIFLEEFNGFRDMARPVAHIVSLGVIEPRKGHLLTIDAFAKLRETVPEAQLTIAGALKNSAYLYKMHEKIAMMELKDCVHIELNASREKIIDLLLSARLFALHSREESQGIALCEALAAGVPVVATCVGGIPYVVSDGVDGLLSEYADIGAFAANMQYILSDSALYETMVQAAKINAARFDWQAIVEEIAALYASTVR